MERMIERTSPTIVEQMFPQTTSSSDFHLTWPTLVWLYPGMDEQMLIQTSSSSEFLLTILTLKSFPQLSHPLHSLNISHHPSQQPGIN